jgi:hypothetical protein
MSLEDLLLMVCMNYYTLRTYGLQQFNLEIII